jgi:hypothetical protein
MRVAKILKGLLYNKAIVSQLTRQMMQILFHKLYKK